MFLSVSFVRAQGTDPTASIGVVSASPGENITVPVNITNFTGIGSITFKIRYNPTMLNFTGISNVAVTGFATGATDSTIHITYFAPNAPTYTDFTDGLLLNLKFEYLGMDTTQLRFLNNCEVTQGLNEIYPEYTNGAVNVNTGNTATATIQNASATTGNNVTVPINYSNFSSNVGAITQKIKYDPTALNFVGITPTGNLVGAIANASNGIITIAWSNSTGANINAPTNLISLNFQYVGNTATNVQFYPGSLITDNTTANIAVSYFNGTVTPTLAPATAILGSLTGVTQGGNIEIPLTFAGLPTGVNGVGAITLEIPFNSSILAYTGVANNTNSATVNSDGTKITIAWSNVTPPDVNGEFLRLKFQYIGVASTTLNFASSCSFTTLLSDVVPVTYTNATITPAVSTANVTIGSIRADQAEVVLIPIDFSGLPVNMGAATLVVNYDESKLTYTGTEDNSFGATVGTTAPNKVTISWSNPAATDINGTFINLRFTKNAPDGDCIANIDFASGCELADVTTAIVHANWINGGVLETVPPTPVTQNINAYLDATGNITILASQIDNGSTDNCVIDTMTVTPKSFNCSNVGPNTVVFAVTDDAGNISSATATVTVIDTIKPVVITKNYTAILDAEGMVTISADSINNGSTDACGIATITVAPNSFNCSNVGANTVVLTVTDVNGNIAAENAIVTVLDTIKPVAIAQNINAYLDATGNVIVLAADVNNGSSDICGIDTMTVAPNTFTCANTGANIVTLTVTDNSGNFSTATSTVTVIDTIKPIAITKNFTVVLNASGSATIVADSINNGSTDACGIASLAVAPNTFTCINTGANTVTLTVTDTKGNVSTATATVTVQDTIKPVAIAQNINAYLDATGNVTILAADVNNGSSDICGIATMTVAPNTFTCSNTGANTVTLTVTDNSNNITTATATVTVIDTIKPTVITQSYIAQLDATGNVTITADNVNNGSSDACGIATMTVSPSSFTCSNVGANTVTLTVTDTKGNVSTATATVTVQDNIAPTAIAKNFYVVLDGTGNAIVSADSINNGSSDNCGIATITLAPNTFTIANVGPNPVVLTVTDVNGNSSTANAVVTVQNGNYFVSGYLKYDGRPRPDTLKMANVIINIIRVSDNAVISTDTTDVNGYYEFSVPNENYKLVAITTKPHGGVNLADVLALKAKITGTFTPLPFENALRLRAADVNVSTGGILNVGDLLALKAKSLNTLVIPTYTAPDWLFDIPTFTVNNSNIEVNFWGICSGDLNGSNTNY